MTKVFNWVFSKFALLTFNKKCLFMQIVEHSAKMQLMLCLTPIVDQQVIKRNGHEFIQYIIEARIHEALKSGRRIR